MAGVTEEADASAILSRHVDGRFVGSTGGAGHEVQWAFKVPIRSLLIGGDLNG
jgi:hypothetical protein